MTIRAGVFALLALAPAAVAETPYFAIRVIDEATGRGVPLVELATVNHILFVTDSGGWAALDEPGLMGRRVYFSVRGHGCEMRKDGFGFAGAALDVNPGGAAEIKVTRRNIAERLYRITGQGIYRDTLLLGRKAPIREPALNGQVMGQDSAQVALYQGKIRWFWGDTQKPSHPLGHFQTSGATSKPPDKGGLDPAEGVDLEYFVDDKGFSAPMVPLPEKGMVWIDGLLVVPDNAGRERMVAHYSRMKSLGERFEHGLAVFNDAAQRFEKLAVLDLKETWRHPGGQSVRVSKDGRDWVYFADPACAVRVPATFEAITNAAAYEAFVRSGDGRRAWSATGPPTDAEAEAKLLKSGAIRPADAWFQPADAATGKAVRLHKGSINWNAFRKKWVMIVTEHGGTSLLGEIWYSEAAAPEGPWPKALKVVTHDRYTFYNPVQHPFFDREGGRIIYFEGTYTKEFSGNPVATPRYDYNQIMYRLDLSDPRLKLDRR